MAVPPFLRRFGEPGRPEQAVLTAVVLGAAALINPAKLGPGRRAAYRVGLAAITAIDLFRGIPRETGPVNRVALTAGAAGTVLGLAELGESIDAKAHGALVRRGVRRPRTVLALATVALSLLSDLPNLREARREAARDSAANADSEAEAFGELPEGARSLITGMLDFSADRGSAALRAQLAEAREQLWDGSSGAYSEIDIDLPHPEALPRVVPHSHVFPVIARFDDPESGQPREVRLDIEEGRLSRLRIEEADDAGSEDTGPDPDWDAEAHERGLWPSAWPARAEVTFSLESDSPAHGSRQG